MLALFLRFTLLVGRPMASLRGFAVEGVRADGLRDAANRCNNPVETMPSVVLGRAYAIVLFR